jgi:hypothetical protein
MRDYRASTVMKIKHYFLLHQHPSLFLLPHLKQRLLRLLPLPQQQCRLLPLMFKRNIHLNKS